MAEELSVVLNTNTIAQLEAKIADLYVSEFEKNKLRGLSFICMVTGHGKQDMRRRNNPTICIYSYIKSSCQCHHCGASGVLYICIYSDIGLNQHDDHHPQQ